MRPWFVETGERLSGGHSRCKAGHCGAFDGVSWIETGRIRADLPIQYFRHKLLRSSGSVYGNSVSPASRRILLIASWVGPYERVSLAAHGRALGAAARSHESNAPRCSQ